MIAMLDRHAERAVLGGLVRDPRCVERLGRLHGDDFGDPKLGRLYRLIRRRIARGLPVDEVALPDAVVAEGGADRFGGLDVLLSLPDGCPSVASVGHYSGIVREHAERRRLRSALAVGLEGLLHRGQTLPDIRRALAAALDEGTTSDGSGWTTIGDAIEAALGGIQERQEGGVSGVVPSFDALRELVPSLDPGRLYLLAARPAMGKSALAGQIAIAAAKAGHGVGALVLEMPCSEMAERHLLEATGINGMDLRRGEVDQRAWDSLIDAAEALQGLPVYYADRSDVTIDDIRSEVRALHRRLKDGSTPLRLVVLDYLQLVDTESRGQSNHSVAIGRISRGLKIMAKELDVAVLALSQLNRDCEKRENKRPVIADLRDSGCLEQDADSVIFVYRDQVYNEDSADVGFAEVIVSKQRNGGLGTARLRFESGCIRFSDPPPLVCDHEWTQ